MEDRVVEITDPEQKKAKKKKKLFNEDSLRDLWDNIKHTNICIMVSHIQKRKKEAENLFEDNS